MNDRLDPADPGPTDEFRLRGYAPSDVVISWTLIDPSGNAVDVGDRLPENFDLSRWQTNTFSLARYDPCCRDPIYRFTGRVDDIRRRPGLVKRHGFHVDQLVRRLDEGHVCSVPAVDCIDSTQDVVMISGVK
jgi:hypothetical protein